MIRTVVVSRHRNHLNSIYVFCLYVKLQNNLNVYFYNTHNLLLVSIYHFYIFFACIVHCAQGSRKRVRLDVLYKSVKYK
jgi:hypothetical protein